MGCWILDVRDLQVSEFQGFRHTVSTLLPGCQVLAKVPFVRGPHVKDPSC